MSESTPCATESTALLTQADSTVASPNAKGSEEIVLHADHMGKEYKLYGSSGQRFKALLTGRDYHRSHWALRDVSFQLHRGQCIGVIGDNGAGKSTLLKLLAGTLQPSTGALHRVGRVTAILELGAGFHPDFTGRENLYFAGNMIGIQNGQMAELEAEIVAFAGLGEAMNRPVKTYSSGMVVRLAFALMTAIQPDVLIVDEALAVGDQPFQKKCVERITAFKDNGCTILFCSHSPYHIRTLCDSAMWLHKGHIQEFGETEQVLGAYLTHTRILLQEQERAAAGDHSDTAAGTDPAAAQETGGAVAAKKNHPADAAHLISVEVAHLVQDKENQAGLLDSRDLVVTITARGNGQECPNIGFMIEQSQGVGITSLATHEDKISPRQLSDGSWQTTLSFAELPLHSGQYVISAFLFDESGLVVYDEWLRFKHLRFLNPTLMPGLVKLPHTWT